MCCRYLRTHAYRHVYRCIELWIGLCIELCVDTCIDLCMEMCTDLLHRQCVIGTGGVETCSTDVYHHGCSAIHFCDTVVEKDMTKARECYSNAIDAGSADAMVELGECVASEASSAIDVQKLATTQAQRRAEQRQHDLDVLRRDVAASVGSAGEQEKALADARQAASEEDSRDEASARAASALALDLVAEARTMFKRASEEGVGRAGKRVGQMDEEMVKVQEYIESEEKVKAEFRALRLKAEQEDEVIV